MNVNWTATDLANALDRGDERDVSDAIAALAVVAVSVRAEARGVDWDGSWEDALALGLRLRETIDRYV